MTDRFGNRVSAGHRIVFSVSGASPTAGPVIVVTDANGEAKFCYAGTKAGNDTITPFADNNPNTEQDDGEPSDTATKTYRPGPPETVALAPATATNVAGEEHCVTATVEDRFGNRVEAGTAVFFSVTGVNPRDPVEKTTNADGQASFCLTETFDTLEHHLRASRSPGA